MQASHELILIGGALGLLSVVMGLISSRLGAPVLLVFLALGMLAGEDGPGGIRYDDFTGAYLVGSIALAVILFEGGLKVSAPMLRAGLRPALAMATIGVAATAGLTALAVKLLLGAPTIDALLIGAAMAPTDAAAVSALLRRARIALPDRVHAVLEIESGLNDPMSVFLMLVLVDWATHPGGTTLGGGLLLFVREMGGGAVFGLAGGLALLQCLRRVRLDPAVVPVFVLTGALALFGLAQVVETSGFLAVFVAAVIIATQRHHAQEDIERFFEALGWLAQIALFLLLGLLVTPHLLRPLLLPSLAAAAALILLARPGATLLCLAPFRFRPNEIAFASWVGLRGAVPIYLAVIPVLGGLPRGKKLFGAAFVMVVISLLVQGWTIGLAARLLGFARIAVQPNSDANQPVAQPVT